MTGTTTASLRRVSSDAPIDEIVGVVHEDGGVIIEGFLTPEQVERFNSEVEPAIGAIAPGAKIDDETVQEFFGSQTKRLTNMVTHSEVFRKEIVDHDLLHALGDAIFLEEAGSYWMVTAQVIEIGPGSPAQPLHRDLENWYPFLSLGPKGPQTGVNFFIALTEFNEANGATRVIPGSNHWPDYEDRGTPEQTIPATMNAGDVLLFSSKVAHGGGANLTTDFHRRALSIGLGPSILTGEEAYPFLVSMDTARSLSPRVQSLIGFRSQYPTGTAGLWMSDYHELADYLEL
ncbi:MULTISPECIES: phytanoyl-CoA dioxygenase family protein [unclassified Rhodococcus (in: high G+C Gram-positive bacteria)]|uniref:phytanoyl-CoA dioxygenase family protein n=1 Tax=unclassified Rhodococcus (in: high G+C Gram-positive bacteria) TaxID=192944 RepID=UPI00163A5077|nr:MULTISPECIES: phytanoyl-CoA dioxygenase family protein [unclassified Rhodococcus (in: high G+C Gram-positive bacteria)]MBC2641983.1 phytanoyl-CoA dioxygenase family protein [Rhodococcus sp. 3A]MBC2893276.1 phytanoyl-CoA dioxygenase family protein [Rhodococcus sp. 4CII]